MKTNKIYQGDSLKVLKILPDESINCVMTSPPYWALRDYEVTGQLGLEPTFKEYINKLCGVFDEVKRVLRNDGVCFVNIGDTYYGSGKGAGTDIKKSKEVYQLPSEWKRPSREAFKQVGIKGKCLICQKECYGDFCSRECLNKKGNDFRSQNRILPDKSLCNIPARFSIEMQDRGWILRNVIIWHKPNCMPCSVKDRFTIDFEYIFMFVKNKKYCFEQQKENLQSTCTRKRSSAFRQQKDDTNSTITTKGRNMRAVWRVCPKGFKEAHFATYPEALCETPIKAGCPKEGIVLDPFFGAGTTGLVALKQGKRFVGIELNKKYIKIAKARLKPYMPVKVKSHSELPGNKMQGSNVATIGLNTSDRSIQEGGVAK